MSTSTNPPFDGQTFGAAGEPKTQFLILQADKISDLELDVEESIEEGWVLQGGIAVDSGKFYIAMTRTE
jgi:hypothetical protein